MIAGRGNVAERLSSPNLADRGPAAVSLINNALSGLVSPENAVRWDIVLLSAEGPIKITASSVGAIETTITFDEIVQSLAADRPLTSLILGSLLFPCDKTNAANSNVDLSQERSGEIAADLLRDNIPLGRDIDLVSTINSAGVVAVLGKSGSGKSTSVASSVNALRPRGWSVAWIDLSDPNARAEDIFVYLCTRHGASDGRHVTVIDNTQSNLAEDRRSAMVFQRCQQLLGDRIRLILISWATIGSHWATFNPVSVATFGDAATPEICLGILKTLDAKLIEQIRHAAAGNLLIVRLCCYYYRDSHSLPTLQELAELAYQTSDFPQRPDGREIATLYYLSSFGQFEIDVPDSYFALNKDTFSRAIVKSRGIRRQGKFISIGHRSYAYLIYIHIKSRLKNSTTFPPPVKIVVDYLRSADRRQILATLERLDLAKLNSERYDQRESGILGRSWDSFMVLLRELEDQARDDISWGDNLASVCFAGEAFASVANELALECLRFVKERWEFPATGSLPKPKGGPTKERLDFDEIVKRMPSAFGRPETIDKDKFHQTWALGVLLSFCGQFRHREPALVNCLLSAARHNQSPEGFFYPKEVPWVTARVLLGLASCGQTIESADVVKRACSWLRKAAPEGPFTAGIWRSGTGSWNTDISVTAMCVMALLRCGVSTTDDCVKLALSFLRSKRGSWATPRLEIDGAMIIQAALLAGTSWREVAKDLNLILQWARERRFWHSAGKTATDTQTESCKVPFVACSLIGVVWDTTRRELGLLLEDLAEFEDLDSAARFSSATLSIPGEMLRACDELARHLEDDIKKRQLVIKSIGLHDEVRKALELCQAQARELSDIRASLAGKAEHECSEVVIGNMRARLNTLGAQVLGRAWASI